jgi:hypothetical protein
METEPISTAYLINPSHQSVVPSKSKLSYDRRSVEQSVQESGHHQGPWPIFLSPWHFFRRLRVRYFVAPSLTIEGVCNLLLLQGLAAQFRSGLRPAGLKTLFYCPNFLESQVPVFTSPKNRVVQLHPRALGCGSVCKSLLFNCKINTSVFNPKSCG